MDTLAHALFAILFYKIASLKYHIKNKINLRYFTLWTIFPDALSFSLLFSWIGILFIFTGKIHLSFFPLMINPPHPNNFPLQNITLFLYLTSHSLLIFSLIFVFFSLIYRKFLWNLTGWAVHILIDIPTHSREFFATRFLWPVSDLSFNGIPWRTPWFLATTYILLTLGFLTVQFLEKKKNKKIHPK